MKKRLLSALLALALVFVLLPTTALAGVTTGKEDYDISINGTGYKFDSDGSNGYITAYYYGNSPSNYFFSTKADHQWTTNSNLMLTKEGNTVTITIRPSKYRPNESPEFNLKKESTSTEKNGVPCIEMGNDNNLVITGKGTLNITRNESKSYGAALYSDVGDITINGGITVNVSFLNGKDYYNKNVSSNAIYVGDNHNLTVSGSGTNVTATNQGFHSSPATVCVEGGTITVSGGASLSATNTYDDNRSGSDDVKIQHFNSYAISGTKSKPCTLIVADEKSSVTATTSDFTNIAESWAFKYTTIQAAGATIKAGSSVSNSTVTTIDNISGQRYAKISVPALQRTPDVLIAGEKAVVGVETSIPSANGSGTYFYDQVSKTLTLKDVNITKGTNAIQFMANGAYTINLVGTNTISDVSNGISVTDDKYITSLNVTITGTGSLDISARGLAINMKKGDLKFENTGEIKLTTSNISETHNVLSVSGDISITDMDKYSVTGITKTGGNVTGDTVTLSEANHLKGYENPDGTAICLKTITIAPKPSETYYNNTAMKYGETKTAGSGTISCNENGVITLNGATEGTLEFRSSADSTLVLNGANTLSSIVTTQMGLTISGSGSLTVGSIRVPNNTQNTANLTITGGAHVTVNRPSSEDKPVVEVSGNLTVTGDGTQLSAECTAATNPAIEVGGNVTISGNPGTNAYTVKAYNKYATQRDRVDDLHPSQMPSAFEISGNLSISGSAQVMAQTDSDGAAVWMPKEKVISVVDASLIAQNSSHNFSTISFGDGSDMGNIYAKGQVNIVAENMLGSNSRLAHRAIKAHIYNLYSTGDSNPYYINVVSEGVQSGGNVNVIPGHCTSTGGYKVTITRGDEVARTESPVVIAGTTLLNDTYYTITNGSTVAEGTENNYNAFYDSASKTLKLNNAQISHSFAHEDGGGTDGAIIFKEYKNYCIELSGTNTISSMNTYAINGDTNSLTIKNAAGTENAKLTLTGNWTAICSTEGLNIQSDVTMVNTKRADHLMYVNGTFSFDGYNAYASVNASGSPLVEYTVPTSGDKDAGYQYLRITKETLETGGGSTHQHTYGGWKSDATHHWQECTDPNCPDPTKGITNKAPHSFSNGACTVCGYRGQTEEHHFSTDWTYDETHHWHACTDDGCTAISGKAPHEWTGWRIDEPSQGMHNRFCNCGYNDYSHHYNLVYAAAGEAGHYQYCTLGNCTFKTSTVPHKYDGDTCTICNYTKSGEIVPPTPDNPGTIVIIRPAEEEKPAQQPNPSTGANDLVGLAVAAAVAAALGSAALLRKHD